jgi:isopentenyl diphosphate isomerase/L-lactate dehydrogenase-like FMN-dependent dehydrogenase
VSAIARRRAEEERADVLFVWKRRRRRWIREVRAADLQEEMAEQRFSVPSAPTKTAATQRTSQRAERAIKQSAMREQL